MNVYLQLLADARKLPGAYSAMGTPLEEFRSTKADQIVRGWRLCQLSYKMNEDGKEWWSNRTSVVVDTTGALWELYEGEEYSPYERPERKSHRGLQQIDGEKLRFYDVNRRVFSKIRGAIRAMI